MVRMKLSLQLASVLIGLAISASAAAEFTSLFVFGDSNSDNGRRLALQGTKPASAHQILGGAMIAAIPEPQSYALMLTGLGLLGLLARRRRFARAD
jgi:phospholipase/lecithinase/hemolysin